MIPTQPLTDCCSCGNSELVELFELPEFPHIGVFLEEIDDSDKYPKIDNSLNYCESCGHIQLGATVDPGYLYTAEFQHQTSQSASATQANEFLFNFTKEVFSARKFPETVVEIGCNDTFLLKRFVDRGSLSQVGVDPILAGKEEEFLEGVDKAYANKFQVIGDFVENIDFAEELGSSPDLFISNFVFEHIRDPLAVTRAIIQQMSDESVGIIGVPGAEFMIYNSRFDQLSHQHYQQFNIQSFTRMIVRAGGEVLASSVNFTNWGQIIVAFRRASSGLPQEEIHAPYSLENVLQSKKMFDNNMRLLQERLSLFKGKAIVGFGAAQNFPVFEYFYDGQLPIDTILDDHPLRQNRCYPHLPYRIRIPDETYCGSVGVLTGPDYARVLVPRMAQLQFDHIIIPFSSI
jgi:hypothetical protein|tara:strand:- start:8043 stop:9251 length:1209 start_codon:yes stop_codon:yes gene_type:complete